MKRSKAVPLPMPGTMASPPGFVFPLVAAICYTQSLVEMLIWAGITCAVPLAVFLVLRRQVRRIEEGHMSSTIMVATFSVAIGLLSAASIGG